MKHFNLKGSALCGTPKARWDEWTGDRDAVTCPYCWGMLSSGIVADIVGPVGGTATKPPIEFIYKGKCICMNPDADDPECPVHGAR